MSIYDKFCEDIEKYLDSKLPDMPTATQMEIGEYISNRVHRLVQEAYVEHESIMDKRNQRYWERYKHTKPEGDS